MKTIELTRGMEATVDDEDYEWLSQWGWYYLKKEKDNTGYAMRIGRKSDGSRNRKGILMHREILGLKDGEYGDHKDGNGLNNQRYNIRKASNAKNCYNQKKGTRKMSSKYKGVSWDRQMKKWKSSIGFNYKKIFIGLYDLEIEAATAYNNSASELYGEFAKINV